ncbi:MAG: DUF2292 domain-containing protein [Patescibacteria group bacterium]
MDLTTRKVSAKLISEITEALNNIKGWGSVEIFIQNYKVVQITERSIKKTKHEIEEKTEALDNVSKFSI